MNDMKNILILILFFLAGQTVFSQGGNFVITYPIAFPLGDLKGYNTKTSFRGITMEFNKHQKPNMDIGIESGWQVFYDRAETKVYTDGTASISGIQYRYTNAVPIIAHARAYFDKGKATLPYVGLGLGTLYVNRSTDFGLYRIITEAWQFCIRPEIGIAFKSHSGAMGTISAKYYAAFGTSNLSGQSYIALNIGFILPSGL
jgi:hypothetical protein